MPVYEYECKACHVGFEYQQRMSDPDKTVCEACGGELERLISRTAFTLKGGGWYKDLYASTKPEAKASESKPSDAGAAASGSSSSESGTAGSGTSSGAGTSATAGSSTSGGASGSSSSSGTSGSASGSSSGSSGTSSGGSGTKAT